VRTNPIHPLSRQHTPEWNVRLVRHSQEWEGCQRRFVGVNPPPTTVAHNCVPAHRMDPPLRSPVPSPAVDFGSQLEQYLALALDDGLLVRRLAAPRAPCGGLHLLQCSDRELLIAVGLFNLARGVEPICAGTSDYTSGAWAARSLDHRHRRRRARSDAAITGLNDANRHRCHHPQRSDLSGPSGDA